MARTVMGDLWPMYLFRLIGEQLQPGDIEQVKHILKDSLTGMSEAYLEPIRSSERCLRWRFFAKTTHVF